MFLLESGKIRYASVADADDPAFASEKELMALADHQELSRQDLESIWNGFAGKPPFESLKKVVKFRNRPYGVQQLWKAVQVLAPSDVDEPDELVPVRERKPKAKKPRRERAAASGESNGFRPDSKSAQALGLMQRERGALLSELMEKLGWQRHTVRGFISTLASKHGVKVQAERKEKDMVYRA